jgi:hypothetical protein
MTAAMKGMIIIARITPANSSPIPSGGPLNSAPISGTLPTVAASAGCTYLANSGANTRRPHMP